MRAACVQEIALDQHDRRQSPAAPCQSSKYMSGKEGYACTEGGPRFGCERCTTMRARVSPAAIMDDWPAIPSCSDIEAWSERSPCRTGGTDPGHIGQCIGADTCVPPPGSVPVQWCMPARRQHAGRRASRLDCASSGAAIGSPKETTITMASRRLTMELIVTSKH